MNDPVPPRNLKRKASQDLLGDSKRSHAAIDGHSVRAAIDRTIRSVSTVQVIDLTVDLEHCAVCPNVLGEGPDGVSSTFVFTGCGCVWNSTSKGISKLISLC